MIEKANNKEALNLNNNYKYITPYTLGLVMASPTNCPIRIGDLLISTISRNPSEDYVGTEWEYFGAGRCLVGVDTSQSEFNTLLKTGGSKTHILTYNEMPIHNHNISIPFDTAQNGYSFVTAREQNSPYAKTITSSNAGGGQAHNNLQPYITCYMWKRIK